MSRVIIVKTMKFQILSDIHLEHYHTYPGAKYFLPSLGEADVLCLCGDIGDPFKSHYVRFLKECSESSYKYVLVITGNHEYYGHHTLKVPFHIRRLCSANPKLVFLHNQAFDVSPNVRVLGTTLWTQTRPEQSECIRKCVNDYKYIKEWSIERSDSEHRKASKFLLRELETCPDDKRIVILTHHAPVLDCGDPLYKGSFLSSAFKNDLEDVIIKYNDRIALWAYGHDHYNMRFKIGDTVVVSNQYGYPDEHARLKTCIETVD